MPLEQSAFEVRLKAALLAGLIFLAVRLVLVLVGVDYRARGSRPAALTAFVTGGLLAAAIGWDGWRSASEHGTRYLVAFLLFTLASGVAYGRKYAALSGVQLLSTDGFQRRRTGTYEMGPADIVLVTQVLLIVCLAQAGLEGVGLWLAWGVVIAVAAIGMAYYAKLVHDLWLKGLQVGSSGPLSDLRDGKRPGKEAAAAAESDERHERRWHLGPILLGLSDWVLFALALFGVPFLLQRALPAPAGWNGAWLCAVAYLAPILVFRARRQVVARRARASYALLVDAVSRDDPRAAAAALDRSPPIHHLGNIAAEALIKRQAAGFDKLMQVFEEGAGNEELIKSLWGYGFANAHPRLDTDTESARLVRFGALLANARCPARQRGVLLGYMLGDMDAGAQSAFIAANPALFGDAALMKELEAAHGMRLVKPK